MVTSRRHRVGGPLLALVICATCSSGSASHATGTTTTATTARARGTHAQTTPAPRAATQACNSAEHTRPLGKMPTPHVVGHRFVLEGSHSLAWLDPSGAATPTIAGTAAWQKLTTGWEGLDNPVMLAGGRARLLLGYFTSPSVGPGPHGTEHILAWVVYKQHIELDARGDGSPAPGPVCRFYTAYSVLNANTGKGLFAASFLTAHGGS